MKIKDPAHPLVAGLEDAEWMIHVVMRVEIRYKLGLRAPLLTLPSYPDQPMEEVYQRATKTNIRGVMVHSMGAGRFAYIPWDVGRTS